MRILTLSLLAATLGLVLLPAQRNYSGPRPDRPDLPYLLHASNLVATEPGEAKEEESKDWKTYVLGNPTSPARTPVAEPIFLLQSEKLSPEKLQLYQLTVKNGRREIAFPTSSKKQKDAPRPIRLAVQRLEPGLFRVEVNHGMGLENGEYCLTPEGSNQVYCFSVF